MKTYFDQEQLLFLVTGIVSLWISIFFFMKKKHSLSLILLFIGGCSLFIFAAQLDHFLNLWDERFHGLVAKNMMNDPFVPKLYSEKLLNIDYSHWASSNIWLHKQPLFLWQIALSFKFFGLNEFAFRVPSIVMCIILLPVIYRSGLLILNKNVGYLAALLFASSFYTYELISGRQMLDQNDIAFTGYITLSIWSWLEYRNSGRKYWLVLIGLFSGMAMLCKWFVGLLVYLAWGTDILVDKPNLRAFLGLSFSAFLSLIIFIPWQIYTFTMFPIEANQEWKYNTMHFSIPIEAHGGDAWYHINQMGSIFGQLVPFILLIGFYLLYKRISKKSIFYALCAMFIGVHIFFSIAATKMPSFTYVLILPMLIVIAIAIDSGIQFLNQKFSNTSLTSATIFVVLAAITYMRIGVEELQSIHTEWKVENSYTRMLAHNKAIFLKLEDQMPENSVLLNVKGRHYVDAMFYTNALAYNFVPSRNEINKLKSLKRNIYIFKSESTLPNYITEDSTITVINSRLQGYE